MNPPQCNKPDGSQFLMPPRPYTFTEAARVQPTQDDTSAHDALNCATGLSALPHGYPSHGH